MASAGKLPRPIGSYTVGRTQMDVAYTTSEGERRELTVFLFYPADGSEGKPSAEYAHPDLNLPRQELIANMGSEDDPLFPPGVQTWCYEGLTPSAKVERFPVLLYSHGASASPQLGTWLCQDLASVGYVVAAVGHQGSGVYRLTDGRLISYTEAFTQALTTFFQCVTEALQTEPAFPVKKLDDAAGFSRRYAAHPATRRLSDFCAVQAQDLRIVADRLWEMNAGAVPSVFRGKLALELGVGAFGHSFGGTTAAAACRDDARFTCGVNLDGDMNATLTDDLEKPFLQLGTVLAYNTNAYFLTASREDSYIVILDGVSHYDFGDSLFTAPDGKYRGTRDAAETRTLIISFLRTFFDQYLRKASSRTDLLSFPNTEIIMGRRTT